MGSLAKTDRSAKYIVAQKAYCAPLDRNIVFNVWKMM